MSCAGYDLDRSANALMHHTARRRTQPERALPIINPFCQVASAQSALGY
jgi:hypothetical protein